DDVVRKILRNVDGLNSVADIVERTGESKFDVCLTMLQHLEAGLIRPLPVEELVKAGTERIRQGRKEEGIRLFEAAIAQDAENVELVARFAQTLDAEGLSDRAARLYVRAGDLAREKHPYSAVKYYERAVALNPSDDASKAAVFEMLLATNDLPAAAQMGEDLAREAIGLEDYEKGRKICEQYLNVEPKRVEFRLLLARVLYRMGAREDLEKQVELIQKNLPVNEDEANRILKEISEFIPGMVERRRVRPPKRRLGRKLIVAALVVVLLGGAGLLVKYHMDSESEYVRCLQEANQLLADGKYDEAGERLDAFRKTIYRYDIFTIQKLREDLPAMQEKIDKQRAEEKKLREVEKVRRDTEMEDLAERMRRAYVGKNLDATLELAAEVRTKAEEYGGYGKYVEEAEKHEGLVLDYRKQAEGLGKRAAALIEQGRYAEAAKAVRDLNLRFGNTKEAQEALYPLCIRCRPGDARVEVDGKDRGPLEEGRMVLFLRGRERPAVRVVKEGYAARDVEIKDLLVGEVSVVLDEKTRRWMMPASTVEPQLYLFQDLILLVSDNGVIALNKRDRTPAWNQALQGTVEVHSWSEGRLLVGTSAPRLYVIDPAQPEGERIVRELTPPARLRTPAVARGAALHFACVDKTLYAYGPDGAEAKWAQKFPVELRHAPVAVGKVVVVFGLDGAVYGVDAESGGAPAWKYETQSRIAAGAWGTEDAVFVGTSDGRVHAVHAGDGVPQWAEPVPVGSEVSAPLTGRGKLVLVGTKEGKLHALSAADGSAAWVYGTKGPITGRPAVTETSVFAGSEDKTLYRLDLATGTFVWRFAAGDPIQTEPRTDADSVYFGSAGRKLYSVGID
ncbi:MAG: outer membrane protein assembly factor BamB family protein, partial [Planctomycetota bacterium]